MLIRSIPARLHYADSIALFRSFLKALLLEKTDQKIASSIAEHINDAGIGQEDILQLVNEINLCQADYAQLKSLPWRKLEQDTLVSLLQN